MFSFGITMWELLIVCCLIFRLTKDSVAQVDGARGARAQPLPREGGRVLLWHHHGVAAPSLLSTLCSDRCPFAGAGGWRQRS